MAAAKKLTNRATVYLEPMLHKALKLKAVETESSISDVVNEAIKGLLSEDADDLAAFEKRKKEPSSDFSDFVKQLKRDGHLQN
jgi:hypothetical protein